MLKIEPATRMEVVRELFEQYSRAIGVDLSFQNFARELATLPCDYDPILVAWNDEQAAGCVATRRLDAETCEMKRLYVRDEFRGKAIGRKLAEASIEEARRRGFLRMRLDTLPSMRDAIKLYESLGFVDIPPYRFNPIEGARFLELRLSSAQPRATEPSPS